MTTFNDRFATVAVPRLLTQFGERDTDDDFKPVQILLSEHETPFDWPRVIVGKLTERLVENDRGVLESREAVTLSGPTAELETGTMPLTDDVQVLVPKYGEESPFHIVPEECEYGGPMTRLSLVRVPVRNLGNFHDTRSG